MTLAPVVLFVYDRVDHTDKVLNSLLQCELSSDTELFIYSDGWKGPKDKQRVEKVRDYLKNISGFKSLDIIEREENWGLSRSVIDGVTRTLEQFEKVIVLEDDLLCHPSFLVYMNEALDYYRQETEVFTVSGYSNIDIPKTYQEDVYFASISSSWGWGTWKDRWPQVNWSNEFYKKLLEDKEFIKKAISFIGNHRVKMLERQVDGQINSWAVRRLFTQVYLGKSTVFPCVSLIKNNGFDGSGTHCDSSHREDIVFNLNERISTKPRPFFRDKDIDRAIFKKNNVTIIERVKTKLLSFLR